MEEQISKTEARQGAGPRQMVSVLFVSMALAILAGGFLLWYFLSGRLTNRALKRNRWGVQSSQTQVLGVTAAFTAR